MTKKDMTKDYLLKRLADCEKALNRYAITGSWAKRPEYPDSGHCMIISSDVLPVEKGPFNDDPCICGGASARNYYKKYKTILGK